MTHGAPQASQFDDGQPDAPLGDWNPTRGWSANGSLNGGGSDHGWDEPEGVARRLRKLDLSVLLATEPEPPAWLWHRYLELGTLGLLHGDGGKGKSLVALGLARAITRGEPFLGWPIRRGPVVYIDAENPLREIHRRLDGFGFAPDEQLLNYVRAVAPILGESDVAEALAAILEEVRAVLLVLDSQRGLWGGDEREALEVREMYARLRLVAEHTDCAILLLHHDNRAGGFSGSSDLNAVVDSRLHLHVPDGSKAGDRRRILTHEKARSAEELRPVEFTIAFEEFGYVFETTGDVGPDSAVTQNVKNGAAFVRQHGRVTTGEIASAVGVNVRTVRRWRDDLAALSIDSDGKGNFWPRQADTDMADMCPRPRESADVQGLWADTDMADIERMSAPESADLQGFSRADMRTSLRDEDGAAPAASSEDGET